jgi:hypothetical protein
MEDKAKPLTWAIRKDTLLPEGLSVSASLWWPRLVLLWIRAVAASTIARVER